jgi:hypothetical protein
MPRVVNSNSIHGMVFDHVGRRLYSQTERGIYWVDPLAVEPHFNGPILPPRSGAIEIASDLGRLYFSRDREHLGYLNLRTNAVTTLVGKEWRGGRLAYEPTHKEIYSPTRARGDELAVYEAETGKLSDTIKLPGTRVMRLEAVPGMVFFSVENRFGLHVIDAATHERLQRSGGAAKPGRDLRLVDVDARRFHAVGSALAVFLARDANALARGDNSVQTELPVDSGQRFT